MKTHLWPSLSFAASMAMIFAVLLLTGCASTEHVVERAVPVRVSIPAQLREPYKVQRVTRWETQADVRKQLDRYDLALNRCDSQKSKVINLVDAANAEA